MAPRPTSRIWRALLPVILVYAAIAALVVWRGSMWGLYALATAPLVLLLTAWWAKRHWAATSRDQLPEYLVSRTVHALVAEWNRAEQVLQKIEVRPGWERPNTQTLTLAAQRLEPHVGRVRATGFWDVRRGQFHSMRPQVLQEVAQVSRTELSAILASLHQEARRRVEEHARDLEALRMRGLSDLQAAAAPREPRWEDVLTAIQRIDQERRAAVEQAVDALDRAQGLAAPVLAIRDEARAALKADDVRGALRSLLRILPTAQRPLRRASTGGPL